MRHVLASYEAVYCRADGMTSDVVPLWIAAAAAALKQVPKTRLRSRLG